MQTDEADRRAGDAVVTCSGACSCTRVWGLHFFTVSDLQIKSWSTENEAVFHRPIFISLISYSGPLVRLIQECCGAGGKEANVLWII